MKTDRFSLASTRAAAVLLASLFLVAGLPAAGGVVRGGNVKVTYESSPEQLAMMLAFEIAEVQKRFSENRRALRTVRGADGKPAYLRQEVADLINRTEKDLDQAIERVGELDALRAWAAEELRRIQEELAAPSGQTASLRSLSTPRAVAVVARLGSLPLTRLASGSSAAPRQETIPAERSDSLLNQVWEVIGRIWFLGDKKELEVELWVGGTPEKKASFYFWSQGRIKGEEPESNSIQINGRPDRVLVLRGLYSYEATPQGSAKPLIQYPVPAGVPTAQRSQGLDLVKRSSFFCCRFDGHYCGHVDDKKDCR